MGLAAAASVGWSASGPARAASAQALPGGLRSTSGSRAQSLAQFAGCPVSTAQSSVEGLRGYDALRLSWNGCWIASPIAVAHPRSEREVAQIVRWCRREGVAVRVRSGGHSFIGDSLCDGVIIDMGALRRVEPGTTPGTARIAGGALLGDVESTLYHALGRQTCTLGSCNSVGISGLLLGGGIGIMSREHGLTIDALESARVVLPSGDTVETDLERYPDLFWAIRGGGGSFGIVTEMVLRTRPWANVHSRTQYWRWNEAEQVLQTWSDWIVTLPPGSSASLVWMTSGTQTSSEIRTIVRSDRNAQDAEQCAASLEDALSSKPVRQKSRTSQPPSPSARIRLAGPRSANSSVFARAAVPAGTAAHVAAAMHARRNGGAAFGDGTAMMICNALGGRIERVASDATAYVHRDARFIAEFATEWTTDSERARSANRSWVQATSTNVRSGFSTGSYSNYADAVLPDWRKAYWGSNLPRLERIKQQIDPDRVFSGQQFV